MKICEWCGEEIPKAKTYNNKFLPADYVDNLYKQYSSDLVEQYIEGNFINLTQGKVYKNFDRDVNGVIKDYDPNLPLILCVDFNVNPMKWVLVGSRRLLPRVWLICLRRTLVGRTVGSTRLRCLVIWRWSKF